MTAVRQAPLHESPYHPYRSTLLSPDRIRALSELRPMRAVVDTMLAWLVIIGAWTAVALYTRWWMVLLAIPIIGARYYALFIIGHDGLHRRLFRGREANDLFNDLCIIGPLAAITRLNNKNHLRHHQMLGSDDDPDRHRHACFNKTDLHELFAFLVGASSIIRSARNVFRRQAKTATAEPATEQSGSSYTLRDIAIILGWQVVLIGGLTTSIGWWAYPLLWLVPVYWFTYLGDNLRSFCEHSQPEADDRADEHRLITFVSNPVERWFVAPMNMNYHAAHHLWVSIPYYNLPRADREMMRHPEARHIEVRGSYVGYVVRYALALPLAGCGVMNADAARRALSS
jgi:fatty acid desaturase